PWITIQGFSVQHVDEKGIYLSSASDHVVVDQNRTQWCFRFGIQSQSSSFVTISHNLSTDNADHGITLTAGSTGCTVSDNDCARNAKPGVRESNGIHLFGAPGNRLERNRVHDNQDSGLHIQSGSNDNLSIQNLSWNNGDHGFDHLLATGTVDIGD